MKIKTGIRTRNALYGFMFIAPWIVGCVVYFVIPVVYSIVLSLNDATGASWEFVGFGNYIRLFTEDVEFIPLFKTVVTDTLINTPMINVFALFVAYIVNKKIRFKGFFRSCFFLPVILGSGFIMQQLLGSGVQQDAMSMATGLLLPRDVLLMLGPTVSEAVVGFMGRITLVMWKSGVQILIYLTGLQSIPAPVYEAAHIDSADEWQCFWLITLPQLTPIILLNFVYTIIDFFSDSSNSIVDLILRYGFEKNQFAYAAAIGWVYFIFSFVLIGIVFVFLN